jgi:hypothetical protein
MFSGLSPHCKAQVATPPLSNHLTATRPTNLFRPSLSAFGPYWPGQNARRSLCKSDLISKFRISKFRKSEPICAHPSPSPCTSDWTQRARAKEDNLEGLLGDLIKPELGHCPFHVRTPRRFQLARWRSDLRWSQLAVLRNWLTSCQQRRTTSRYTLNKCRNNVN